MGGTDRVDGPGLTWRPVNRADAPALVRLFELIEQADQAGMYTDETEISAQFDEPGLSPGRDTLGAVLPGGDLAAFGVVYAAPAARDTQRIFLSGGVRPDWRGRGLGRRILDWQIARAEETHREIRPDLPAQVEAGGVDRDDPRGRILRRAGFAPVRWWYEMARDLSAPLPETPPLARNVTFTGYEPGHAQQVRQAHNEAFADHWGTAAVDEHVWAQRFSAAQGFRPDLSLVAIAGSEIAAYLLSFVHTAEIAAVGAPTAHVGYLGTRRAWRRQGLGGALLSTAMRGFRDAGYTVARLVVDTENGSGALDVYRRAGFEVDRRWVTYGRRLAPVPE